jgi:hypothetical protein
VAGAGRGAEADVSGAEADVSGAEADVSGGEADVSGGEGDGDGEGVVVSGVVATSVVAGVGALITTGSPAGALVSARAVTMPRPALALRPAVKIFAVAAG